jgi:outer membrane protein insertion porin family
MPMTINELRIHGASNTRRGFLDPLFQPLLAGNRDAPSTIGEVMASLQVVNAKLGGLRRSLLLVLQNSRH